MTNIQSLQKPNRTMLPLIHLSWAIGGKIVFYSSWAVSSDE